MTEFQKNHHVKIPVKNLSSTGLEQRMPAVTGVFRIIWRETPNPSRAKKHGALRDGATQQVGGCVSYPVACCLNVSVMRQQELKQAAHLAVYFSATSLLLLKANSARDYYLCDFLHAFEDHLVALRYIAVHRAITGAAPLKDYQMPHDAANSDLCFSLNRGVSTFFEAVKHREKTKASPNPAK